MLSLSQRNAIDSLIRREVVPAVGCTEPVAVALCVAKATALLGVQPEKISVALSGNMLKNAMGVGIPGTGMLGLPIAIAIGAIIGDPDDGLEVLGKVTPEAVAEGKKWIEEGRIDVSLAENAPSKLYIDVEVKTADRYAHAIVARSHTNFVFLADASGNVLLDNPDRTDEIDESDDIRLNLAMVWDYAINSPIGELEYIDEARRLNKEAAEVSLKGSFGHALGVTLREKGSGFIGGGVLEKMLTYTSAACDARMSGAPVPVMSNSGSGNQGITATLPVVLFAEQTGASRDKLLRALTLSHLTSIYIKQSLGRLSALCGCVVASTGASAGLVYLMNGDYSAVCAAVKNMIANLTGMICDGAKPSCSMKISSGVSTAMLSAMLAINGKCVSSAEGIVTDDVDRTISNLTSIGREAMTETDRLVLKIMTEK